MRCGPKAANLGQLGRFFPDHVARESWSRSVFIGRTCRAAIHAAAALPIRFIKRTKKPKRCARAEGRKRKYARSLRQSLQSFGRPSRRSCWIQSFVKELRSKLDEVFGKDGTYGVFVRSDTNAEDLPQFTGAGLNLTVPNVVGIDNILNALRDVWASPFEERAYAWRSQALTSSDRVYPSVVLYRTIRSDKSGVMATANLATLDLSGITVNVNEGVAAVVDGGVSESLLLEADGRIKLLGAGASAPIASSHRPAAALLRGQPAARTGFSTMPKSLSCASSPVTLKQSFRHSMTRVERPVAVGHRVRF